MNKKLKNLEYAAKAEIRARFFPSDAKELYRYKGIKKFFIFLCGYYQNAGDMAITYAQEQFLRDNFPEYDVVMVPGYRLYHWYKTIKEILTEDDILTVIGGGNMDDLYVQLEDARRFIIRNFKNNPIISFPQTIGFTDTPYGRRRKKKTASTYNKNENLKVFAREKKSFEIMKETFSSEPGFCPDIVLYLDKKEPSFVREGVLCCLRRDKEQKLSDSESNEIKNILKEKYGEVVFKDTVDITKDECKPENLSDTLERFWSLIKSKKVVVTDRLHCMIFCAITKTPCVVFDNSNHKISGVYNAWLGDCEYIKMCGSFNIEDMLKYTDELMKINISNCRNIDFDEKFNPLKMYIESLIKS